MVLPRILTAVVMIPVVLACVWTGSIPFFLFMWGVCMLCSWEFSLIAEEGGYPNQLVMSLLGTTFVLFALFIDGVPKGPIRFMPMVTFILVFWSFIIFVRELARHDKQYSLLRAMTTITNILLCAFFLGHLLLIRDLKIIAGEGFQPVGREFVFFILFVIWTLDTGAWMVGRLWGRHPFAPSVSPKKTWEGAVGAVFIAMGVGWLCREIFLQEEMGRVESILFSLAISVTAHLSDLIESLIKRSCGVKDSSRLLPGHGGLLDRFDSLIFSAPIFYYLLIATGRFR